MKNFLNHFIQNNGIWVGGAVLISKLCVFLTMILAVNFLPKEDFGLITTALNFLAFFTVIAGGGSYQGVLRFGAISEGKERTDLKNYAFAYGLLLQFLISFIFIAAAAVFYWNQKLLIGLLAALLVRFFGLFLLEQAKAESRADFDNKKFAILDISSSVALLVMTAAGLYTFGYFGYLLALCISPFTALLFHRFRFSLQRNIFRDFTEKEFWNFSVTSALATQVGEWVFLLDVFFISMLLGSSSVAEFRVSNTIPMNLIFIAYIILQTGYPELCKNYRDLKYQRDYLWNYFKTLLPVAVLILVAGYLFSPQIMSVYGQQYKDLHIFRILLLVCISVMLLRAPFSYVLAALGKPKWTLWVSLFMMVLLSVTYYSFGAKFGLEGFAWINVAGVTLSGILYGSAYLYESRKLS